MITLALLGIALITLLAVAVRIVDAARAPMWRAVAAERRLDWERSRAQRGDRAAQQLTSR